VPEWPWGAATADSATARYEAAERLLRRREHDRLRQSGIKEDDYGDGSDFQPRPRNLGGSASWHRRERVFIDITERRDRGTDRWKQKGGKHGTSMSPNQMVLRSYGSVQVAGGAEQLPIHEYKLAVSSAAPAQAAQAKISRQLRLFHIYLPGSPSSGGGATAACATAAASSGSHTFKADPPHIRRGLASTSAERVSRPLIVQSPCIRTERGRAQSRDVTSGTDSEESRIHLGTHTFRAEPALASGGAPAPHLVFEDATGARKGV
jgi:hypothetical protein